MTGKGAKEMLPACAAWDLEESTFTVKMENTWDSQFAQYRLAPADASFRTVSFVQPFVLEVVLKHALRDKLRLRSFSFIGEPLCDFGLAKAQRGKAFFWGVFNMKEFVHYDVCKLKNACNFGFPSQDHMCTCVDCIYNIRHFLTCTCCPFALPWCRGVR